MLAALTDAQLRAVGISRQKTGYLRDLAERVNGALDLDAWIDTLADEEVIRADEGEGHRPLVGGHVPDVPAASARRPARRRSGHRERHPKPYRLRKGPTPDRMRKIGEAWRPYRSVACWYLWRSLDNEP